MHDCRCRSVLTSTTAAVASSPASTAALLSIATAWSQFYDDDGDLEQLRTNRYNYDDVDTT